MASKPGGLKVTNGDHPETISRSEVAERTAVESRPVASSQGRLIPCGKKRANAPRGSAGIETQAPRERLAGLTSGKAHFQQGLAATCKDLSEERLCRAGRRIWVWRMSTYELGRRGNAL